jgi:hypothetical protein
MLCCPFPPILSLSFVSFSHNGQHKLIVALEGWCRLGSFLLDAGCHCHPSIVVQLLSSNHHCQIIIIVDGNIFTVVIILFVCVLVIIINVVVVVNNIIAVVILLVAVPFTAINVVLFPSSWTLSTTAIPLQCFESASHR